MRGAQDLLWGLLKMGFVAAGALYALQVVLIYAKAGGQSRTSFDPPAFDPKDRLRSVERLLVWGGAMAVWLTVRLVRPFINMLSEASAEVGEWAISRSHVSTRTR